MSVKLTRALYCDGRGCPNVSIDVWRTLDTKNEADADWQGWKEIPAEPDHGDPTRPPNQAHHLCPDCVSRGIVMESGKHD